MSTYKAPSSYTEGACRGIKDETLQKNLQNLQDRFGRGALEQWASLSDPDLRHRTKARRMKTLDNLDVVLAELIANVQKKGGQVFCARTADEAAHYCLEVARKHNDQPCRSCQGVSSDADIQPTVSDSRWRILTHPSPGSFST